MAAPNPLSALRITDPAAAITGDELIHVSQPGISPLDYESKIATVDEIKTYILAGVGGGELPLTTETGNYTLEITDAQGYVRMNLAGANTLTVPPNSAVAFPVGTQVVARQVGAGQTTITAGSGVTIHEPGGFTLALRAQHSTVTLIKVAANEWDLLGDLEAV